MSRCDFSRRAAAFVATLCLMGSKASALVRWDESRNQIFVTAVGTLSYDSNIYAIAGGENDWIASGYVGLEYQRRAGLIGVDGRVGYTFSEFADHAEESFANPSARVELTKREGRTTGSITLGTRRDSLADPAANRRTDSWNHNAGLNVKYPVIERYSVSGAFNYDRRDYQGDDQLVDLTTFTAATDLLYAYTSERDLLAGYRLRLTETSANTEFEDHALTIGVSGRILPKLNGSLRFGYQWREGRGPDAEDDAGFTAGAAATWNISKRSSVTLQLTKDYSTSSTNVSIDSLAARLDGQHAFTSRFAVAVGVGAGENRFLGPLGDGREDRFVTGDAQASYSFSERLRLSLAYSYYQNWSTNARSDFTRHAITFSVSTRF